MKRILLLLAIVLVHNVVDAQVPAEWPVAKTQITNRLNDFIDTVDARWDGHVYCTQFSGNLLLANSNQGYRLFSPNPPSPPNALYQAALFRQIDSMLKAYDSLGYKAVDITINFPLLVDTFPHSQDYLAFYKKVYQMARNRGLKIIEGCQATFTDSVFGEQYLGLDVFNFYNNYGTPHDTMNSMRYRTEKLQMMQTIIDSLQPDYLTIETEPGTQAMNMDHLVSYTPDSVYSYVNYFVSHLNKRGTLLGAGAGTWDTLTYVSKLATLGLDYIDYHVYPTGGRNLQRILSIDSIAKANSKKIVIGEAWCNKLSDSEYNALDPLTGALISTARSEFDYWEPVDTLFIKAMVRLSQQAKIDAVSFFYSNNMFGQLTYDSSVYNHVSYQSQITQGQKVQYAAMINGVTGPIGIYTRSMVKDMCDTPNSVANILPRGGMAIYPNPAYNNFTIRFGSPLAVNSPLSIIDIYGRTIRKYMIAKGTTQYNVTEQLDNGIYIVRINTGSAVLTRKLIIR